MVPNAFQLMQKLMALDLEQLIEFKGKTLHNFLPQSLKWEIGFIYLMLSWTDADIHKLHPAITYYDIMVSSPHATTVTSRLCPIQLCFQSNDVATALLACDWQHLKAHDHKIQQQQLQSI